MSNRIYTVTLTACGDLDEAQDRLNAYLAGLAAAQQYFMGGGTIEPEGPEAVDAPALNAGAGNFVMVTIPNFVVEEGINYTLQYTDNNWENFETAADVGPNDEVPWSYTPTRKFRVSASGTPGPSAGPIP